MYGNWSAAPNVASLPWEPYRLPASVPNLTDALMSFWVVPNSHDFTDTPCPITNLDRPTPTLSSLEVDEKGWNRCW
ncbi:hypothetical protein DEIPH_ctg009orf0005 [Deinococcus phoenicis]|uniref:Uncharacterized protein n=1 Tax=Deinococcus phoenicis TaxID=1476583 RepID=A0A016QTQ7_9DEIO|nr:hypothetical protein DEIPH_ctg009orf0005 [Deinococcus phoenicis]